MLWKKTRIVSETSESAKLDTGIDSDMICVSKSHLAVTMS